MSPPSADMIHSCPSRLSLQLVLELPHFDRLSVSKQRQIMWRILTSGDLEICPPGEFDPMKQL